MIDNVMLQFIGMMCEGFEDFSTAKHVMKNDKPAKHAKIRAFDVSKNTYKHPVIARDTMFTAVTARMSWVEREVPFVPLISYLLSRYLPVDNKLFVNQ